MKQPPVPRQSTVLRAGGLLDIDYDRFLQGMANAVSLGTSAGAYANNAAALAAGLVVGQVYHTAAGDLRIVV